MFGTTIATGLPHPDHNNMRLAFSTNAYLRYPFAPDDYGMTWHSRAFIETTMQRLHEGQVVPLLFKPHGLDGHQDVFAFERIVPSA